MKLKDYLTEIRIVSTANPNGVTLSHDGNFDPTGKAVATKDGWVIPAVNTLRKARTPEQEAGVIINMTSKKLKQAKG